jgi:hypothetical protein
MNFNEQNTLQEIFAHANGFQKTKTNTRMDDESNLRSKLTTANGKSA